MEQTTILLVDTQASNLTELSQQLTEKNYNVRTAYGATSTLEELAATPSPDLVLLCFELASRNKFALLQEIKNLYPNKQIILASDDTAHEHTEDTAFTGAYTIIPKPVDVDTLLQSLTLTLSDKMDGAFVAASLAQAGAFEAAEDTISEMDAAAEVAPQEEVK